jgi:eukaryotic-like serine/threonine-protein kinase
MQPPAPFNPGTSHPDHPDSIGPFRILRLLGVGGMGAVYLGERMEQFSQQVAIKILHPHLFPTAAESRLHHEGRMLAALEHPGVVRLLDLGATADGLQYIVMDYVDGIPIDAYCDRDLLPLRHRIQILLDVCEAVENAHRHLVVHADLKPENILVTAEGKPRLLDFGVAAILSELGASSSSDPDSDEGQHTALYASPEQRSGERLTVASDIYSLGLIAQSVLTGLQPEPLPIGVLHANRPITATAAISKKLRALNHDALQGIAAARATSPSGLQTAIHGDLEAILAKALRLDPKERFPSVQQFHDELERSLLGYPILTRPARWPTRFRKWVLRNRLAASLGCVFLLAVLFSIAGVVRQSMQAARKRQIAQTRLHELVRLTDLLAGELYESVHGLQGSESAQAALLNSAHQTIDQLAADDDRDPQLELELAREYEKLAQLELSRTPLTSEATRLSTEDIQKEVSILKRMDGNNPEVAHIKERLPLLMQSNQDAAKKQAR